MMLKMDMEKADDHMDWGFLEEVLFCLGFCETWINWLMECVRTPTFSVLLNGGPCGKVVPRRGLR